MRRWGWIAATAAGLGVLVWAGKAAARSPWSGGLRVIDRRKHAQLTQEAADHTSSRPDSDVYALVLHQTGFSRGSDPGSYDRVTAHYVLLPDGSVVWLHDHTTRLPAAGGLNEGGVSVEVVGNFPSRARSTEPAAFWNPERNGMDQLSAEQVAGGRALVTELRRQGWLTHILAHRQGGPNRQNDPGPDIWREIGAWAVREYGLQWGGEGFAVNGGQPIPSHWWSSPSSGAVA